VLAESCATLARSVNLVHIDAGGEGVPPSFVSLIRRCAVSRKLEQIEWLE
jgi:hypothetical protein